MKNSLITLLLILPFLTGFSQDVLNYEVRGKYSRPVKKEKLQEAKLLSDFIPGYPSSWITSYTSVEISTICDGKLMKAVSSNDVLSAEQKNILNNVNLADDIVINVKYKYANLVTGGMENNNIHISMTVVPEIEAEYVGGRQQMINYLKENVIHKISESSLSGSKESSGNKQAKTKLFQEGIVVFTVNEEGEIVNAKIFKTSGDSKTDKLLLETINKMPKWKPAKNSKGAKVKQEFELSVRHDGGC